LAGPFEDVGGELDNAEHVLEVGEVHRVAENNTVKTTREKISREQT
jgi:hypothetical protein